MRFYVVAYARQREEHELFETVAQYMKDQYVEIGEMRWTLLEMEDAQGKYGKYRQMRTLVELGEDSNDISTTMPRMLRVLTEV